MKIEKCGRTLPYSREQLFDLAADIERYPEFLRGWTSARITGRRDNRLQVSQAMGFGPLQLRFDTTALLHRPEHIDVHSSDPIFEKFSLCLLISAPVPQGSRLTIAAELEMRSRLQQLMVHAALSASVEETVSAFELRAQQLYSPH